MEKLAYILPGRLLDEVGIMASKKSRKKSSNKRRDSEETLRQLIRKYAEDKITETDFDLIVTGHMHVKDVYEFEAGGKKRVSINLGSWFEEPQALLLTEQGFSWQTL
jgi:UDP-2,3-diacylglucosamine pyrophosphatase LpxH